MQSAVVLAEDRRIQSLQHHSRRLLRPTLLSLPGTLPTLVLPPRSAAYTVKDLTAAGTLVPQPHGTALLVANVLVAPRATLVLGSPMLTGLLMGSGPKGFTSIVAWGATLKVSGASVSSPFTIRGWDQAARQAAADEGRGRPYIRAIGSRMDLRFVNASSLGFATGRTGGAAWTGTRSKPSTGGADSSRFIGDAYGAFLSRTQQATFTNDLFEANEFDGLRVDRNAVSTSVLASTAARNGGNGIAVVRGATGARLAGDQSVNNSGNGYLLDGRPLATGGAASLTPAAVSPTGLVLARSSANANGRAGIAVRGGVRTVLDGNRVCGPTTAIAVHSGATGTVVTANDINCPSHTALSIGANVIGTTIGGNRLADARIGVLIRDSSGVRLIDNTLTGMTVFGVSLRGSTRAVVADGNAISGRGVRAIDMHRGTNAIFTNSDTTGWTRRSHLSARGYLRYHPMLLVWVAAVVLLAAASGLGRLRRRPRPVYEHKIDGAAAAATAHWSTPPIEHPVRKLPAGSARAARSGAPSSGDPSLARDHHPALTP